MIKFFRPIRKDLMENNKAGKYLKYAIGEIVLVVVGILIALSINNWSEQQKLNQKEQGLLKELNLDFKYNQIQLDSQVTVSERAKHANMRLLKKIQLTEINKMDINKLDQKLMDSIRYYFFTGFDNWTLNPKNGTINAIVNSASLDIIKNDSLRRTIISWNDVLSDYLEDERKNEELFNSYSEWRRNNYDLTKGAFDPENVHLIFSKEQKNFYWERSWRLGTILKELEEVGVIELVETIITLTDNEIKK